MADTRATTWSSKRLTQYDSLASTVDRLATVVAVEKLAVEQLHGNDGKDEMEQYVHDQYVYYVFQRVDHAIEHGLELGNAFDGLQRPQHSQYSERFNGRQVGADRAAAATRIGRVVKITAVDIIVIVISSP